jgi:membrane protease YdiL (CAAX protease family)
MNLKIEIKYTVLISLLMLLWLSLEFMIGLHEKPLIAYHPYITMFALFIPIICAMLAVNEKREFLEGRITFKQAFLTGLLIAVFTTLVSPLIQWIFFAVVNPDFFDNMIAYSIERAHANKMTEQQAQKVAVGYFNLQSYIIQSALFSFIGGIIIATVVAVIKRSKSK